jgi:hypothetical protein
MLAAVLEGIALPGSITDAHRFRRPEGDKTDLLRMRSDMLRINATFKRVVSRNGNAQASTRTDAKDSSYS